MRRIEVTYSTMGESSPNSLSLSKPYRWRQMPGWVPGDARYREAAPRSQLAGCEARTARRQKKIDLFAAVLAELGYPDPAATIPPPVIRQAGEQVGVGEKTAKSYRTALKKQQRGEARDD